MCRARFVIHLFLSESASPPCTLAVNAQKPAARPRRVPGAHVLHGSHGGSRDGGLQAVRRARAVASPGFPLSSAGPLLLFWGDNGRVRSTTCALPSREPVSF